MKKFLVLLMALVLLAVPVMASAVTLTMGSWRADDVEQMNNLLAIYQEQTGVEILFQPINPQDYNASLRVQLEGGTGPDLMYARSYATGRSFYEDGYFADCTDIEGLLENFTELSRAPWEAEDGNMFAVPFAAVSQIVYYNMDIFAEHGLEIPNTWEEFIAICDTLQEAGVTPLANGVADEWDVLECFLLCMLPNYIGGAEERVKYETGEKKLNDEAFVELYTDFASLSKYLPAGFESVTYNDSQVLFGTGRAAMFFDGSWTCGTYDDVDFEWSVFAVPAREGGETRICFHPDLAITMNTATEYPDEARAFLTWHSSVEGATEASKALPDGYFPMINAKIELEEPHANAILALNEGKETDARFTWPVLDNLYVPMNQEAIKLLKGEVTPQEAADAVAAANGE